MIDWLQLTGSFFGSVGFAMMFHLKGKKVLWTAVGGGMAWFVYLLIGIFYSSYGIQFLCSSIALGFYTEIMALITKMPRTAYIAVGIIPLIPGSALYHTMFYLIQKDMITAKAFAFEAVVTSTAIAAGFLIAMELWKLGRKLSGSWRVFGKINKKRKNN